MWQERRRKNAFRQRSTPYNQKSHIQGDNSCREESGKETVAGKTDAGENETVKSEDKEFELVKMEDEDSVAVKTDPGDPVAVKV